MYFNTSFQRKLRDKTDAVQIVFLPLQPDLTTTPKRGGIKGDPKRVNLFPEFELFHAFIFFQLPLYILSNLFFIKTYGTDTVSFGPKVPSPVPFLEFQMFIEYLDGTFSFQKTNYIGY